MGVFTKDNAEAGVHGQLGKSGYARCFISKLFNAHQW